MSSSLMPKSVMDLFVRRSRSDREVTSRNITLIVCTCILAPLFIAYGFSKHDEIQVFAIIVGVICVAIGLAHPFWGMVIFVALLYIRPEETIVQLRGMHFTLIAAVVATASVIIQKMMDREAPVKLPVNTLIVSFGVLVVASTLHHGGTSIAVMDAGKLVALVLMICNLVRTPERYRILSFVVIVFTAYLGAFSIFQYYAGNAFDRSGLLQAQGTGIFSDPNDLSATLVAGMGLALCRAISDRGKPRLFYAANVVVMIWAIYLSNSRGGMLAMVGVIAAFAMIYSRSRWVALAIVLVIGAAAVKLGPSRMQELDTSEESANSRFRFWVNGTRHFIANPLLGIGYGGFSDINNGYTAHNSFVLCYTELGFPGYISWMGCLFYSFLGLRTKKGALPPPEPLSRPQPGQPKPREPSTIAKARVAHTAAWHDSVGARLALGGFLLAAFFISRTYVPILYLLISLPLAQQIAYSNGRSDFSLTPVESWRDGCILVVTCVLSIAAIFLLALRLKG